MADNTKMFHIFTHKNFKQDLEQRIFVRQFKLRVRLKKKKTDSADVGFNHCTKGIKYMAYSTLSSQY